MNDFWTWVRFAWHNCLRNLRRSLVTTAIAMLGTAAILLAGGFALFTYDSLAQASARDTGHLVLVRVSAKLDRSEKLMSPEEVALFTVRALDKNKAIIIPGRRNRWLAFSPRFSPRWLTRKIAGAINKAYCPR